MLIFGIVMLIAGLVAAIAVSGALGAALAGVGLWALYNVAQAHGDSEPPESRDYGGAATYTLTSRGQKSRR